MNGIQKIRKGMDLFLGGICILIFMLLTVIGTYQIVVRYLFNRPSTVSEELLTYGFAWLALLSAALVFGKREHMRMGFLADKIKGNARTALEVIIELLILGFVSIVMVYGGIEIVKLTMSQQTASLGIPMGIIYVVVIVSGIFTVLYSLLNILQMVSGTKHRLAEENFDKMQERAQHLTKREIEKGKNSLLETEEL